MQNWREARGLCVGKIIIRVEELYLRDATEAG
jgi:hypothetical protein